VIGYLKGDQSTGADVLNAFVFEKVGETWWLGECPHLQGYTMNLERKRIAVFQMIT